ncbi:hypothetical protein MMC18_001104 [Xylographa bjoerkii]|nr:hypothetical protein [Xylographa bjoerkii]
MSSPSTNNNGWIWSIEENDYYRTEIQPNGEPQGDRDTSVAVPELMRKGQRKYIFFKPRANQPEGSTSSVPVRAPHQIVPSSRSNTSSTSPVSRTQPIYGSSPSTPSTGYGRSLSQGSSTTGTYYTQNQYGKQPINLNMETLSVSDNISVPSNVTRFNGVDVTYDSLDPCEHAILITLGSAAAINPGKRFARSNRNSSGTFGNQVFKALWWETHGESPPAGPSIARFKGETAFAKVYRFIVVRACPKEFWSNCLRISTHGGQATLKKGLDQRKHTIVYSSNQPPSKLPGEKRLNKDPIRINIVNMEEKLDDLSRVNLAKTYPVEHNVKVKKVGMVRLEDLKKLKAYWKECVSS